MPWGVNKITGKPGPAPMSPRDGDKLQARQRINVEVRTGYRPHPNSLPCHDCGHAWIAGERRHEYDHYLGYDPENHYNVQAVCSKCHHRRTFGIISHCTNGHEFTEENTQINKNGHRNCRACSRAKEKKRGPRGSDYWKRVNAKRNKS